MGGGVQGVGVVEAHAFLAELGHIQTATGSRLDRGCTQGKVLN